MKPSPLQLEGSFFDRVEIETYLEHVPGPHESSIGAHLDLDKLDREDGPDRWQVSLELEVIPKPGAPVPPYGIFLSCCGYFTVLEGFFSPDQVDRLVGVNGGSMLYSAAREYLLLLTSRCLWGPFQLPTVTFLDFQPGQVSDDLNARIFEALAAGKPLPIKAIARLASSSTPRVQEALKELEDTSQVRAERIGNQILYTLAPSWAEPTDAQS